jgi:hypothetical protein
VSRHRLHFNKIDAFAAFCESQGFTREQPIESAYEVLRLRKPGTPAVIAHAPNRATQHATLHGMGERMFSRWMRQRNAEQEMKP